jgi:hypothetical protein
MSFQGNSGKITSVQCKNKKCYFWTHDPKPGAKCVKCMEVLPIWTRYLNADKDNGQYIPPSPLEPTDYQETSRFLERTNTCGIDELIDYDSPQLKPTDDNLTNEERVVREIMIIYRLDREGAIKKLDHMAKTAKISYM